METLGNVMGLYLGMIVDAENIPKFYTALAEWASCLVMILGHQKEIRSAMRGRWAVQQSIFLLVLLLIQMLCGILTGWPWLIGMLMAMFAMTLALRRFTGTDWNGGAYLCARAFTRAEFVAALEWQIYYYYFNGTRYDSYVFSILFCLVVYALVFGLFYLLERRNVQSELEENLTVPTRQLVTIWVIAVLIFAISNLSYVDILSIRTPFTWETAAEIFNSRTLIDLAGVCMLELFHMQKADADRVQEMASIQNIARMQYAQFRESQENIDTINRKYHDLKHQIQVIRSESDDEKRLAYLDEIEAGIRGYESEIKTGNTVLDTVLSSKSAICQRRHIGLTVVADGALLSHLHVTDLCAIFGNALDNAIEYEVQVPEEDRRMIHVSVSERRQLICIVVENYYEGKALADGQIPETTKEDKRYHGFGMKSIRYTVGKYGGHLNMGVRDEWFRLEMLLPKAG